MPQILPQRFSFYIDERDHSYHIEEDPNGRWMRWREAEPYIKHCAVNGVTFDAIHQTGAETPAGQDHPRVAGGLDDINPRGGVLPDHTPPDEDDVEGAEPVDIPDTLPCDWGLGDDEARVDETHTG